MADIDKIVARYITVRDKKTEMAKRHKKEVLPYNDALEKMENALLKELNVLNLESFKGAHGTAFTVTKANVKIIDFDIALDYILDNDMKHVLEKRLSKTAVQEFVQNEGVNFPGTDITQDIIVQVRRK